MKRAGTHGEEPLSTFALLVTGIEMLAVAAIICYACMQPSRRHISRAAPATISAAQIEGLHQLECFVADHRAFGGRGAATCCRHGFLLLRFLKLEVERVFGRTLLEWEALLLGQWVLFPGQAPRSDEGEAAGWSAWAKG